MANKKLDRLMKKCYYIEIDVFQTSKGLFTYKWIKGDDEGNMGEVYQGGKYRNAQQNAQEILKLIPKFSYYSLNRPEPKAGKNGKCFRIYPRREWNTLVQMIIEDYGMPGEYDHIDGYL